MAEMMEEQLSFGLCNGNVAILKGKDSIAANIEKDVVTFYKKLAVIKDKVATSIEAEAMINSLMLPIFEYLRKIFLDSTYLKILFKKCSPETMVMANKLLTESLDVAYKKGSDSFKKDIADVSGAFIMQNYNDDNLRLPYHKNIFLLRSQVHCHLEGDEFSPSEMEEKIDVLSDRFDVVDFDLNIGSGNSNELLPVLLIELNDIAKNHEKIHTFCSFDTNKKFYVLLFQMLKTSYDNGIDSSMDEVYSLGEVFFNSKFDCSRLDSTMRSEIVWLKSKIMEVHAKLNAKSIRKKKELEGQVGLLGMQI